MRGSPRRRLPWIDDNVDRRTALLAACGVALGACGPGAMTADTGGDPDTGVPPRDAAPDATPDASNLLDAATPGPDAVPPDEPASSCPGGDAGPVSDYPEGRFRTVASLSAIVARDSGGLYAYSNVCTHNGCTIPAPTGSPPTSRCPCHGSRFDANGQVLTLPATRPLLHYRVYVCEGRVRVDTIDTVPEGVRTPVP